MSTNLERRLLHCVGARELPTWEEINKAAVEIGRLRDDNKRLRAYLDLQPEPAAAEVARAIYSDDPEEWRDGENKDIYYRAARRVMTKFYVREKLAPVPRERK